ncbi:hypothetical protein V1260_13355 [Brachybacterium sp. J144]|uniref:hypothetical protein n=1 Tax=Brachybacterium sp. J144 TaxID=3116487 RepID=UPI002E79B9A8|nr:hypothetical protein [Brachybacterium sp. J144]MEE1651769.1 hypothetical protein [Brachybacterium sp. J144]
MDEDGTTAGGPGDGPAQDRAGTGSEIAHRAEHAAGGAVGSVGAGAPDSESPRSLRGRATASVAALGAATLLVLSFGPSALALSPTPSAAGSADAAGAVWTTPLTGQTPILGLPPRSAEDDGSDG